MTVQYDRTIASNIQFLQIAGKDSNNPVNSMSESVRKTLIQEIRLAQSNPQIKAIVLVGSGKNFSAGADIREFGVTSTLDDDTIADISLTNVCNVLENSTKPVVAAVRGVALGGGCEIALACRYRVCVAGAKFGLPETKIGLIPGAGGTQRLPPLVGTKHALDMILSGRMVGSKEAQAMGLVDSVVSDADLEGEAASMARKLLAGASSVSGRKDAREDALRLCDKAAQKLPPKELGGESRHAAVAAIRASATSSFQDGMEVESEQFYELLLNSSQSRALRYAFFAERRAQSSSKQQLTASSLYGTKEIATVGVIGAGTMGSGIAISFLRAGYKVVLVDVNPKGLKRGVSMIQKVLQTDVKKKKMSPEKLNALLSKSKFTFSTEVSSVNACQLVVEAVFENLALKQKIFRQLETVVSPRTVLVSNTSTLSVDLISAVLQNPSRCAGMHFFSPAHVMQLVEIVKGSESSPSVIHTLKTITKRIKKLGVVVGNCDGFVGNRMYFPYAAEAVFCVEEGAQINQIDKACKFKHGMAIGPFEVGDLAGNDIGYLVRKSVGLTRDETTNQIGPNREPHLRYTEMPDLLVTKFGRVGQKALKGWYDYDKSIGKGRKPLPSPEVLSFIDTYRKNSGIHTTKSFKPTEIIERVFAPLVNEGFKILEENIARQPGDIDIIFLYGYGWPAWRGGPMFWADNEIGLPKLLQLLESLYSQYPGSDYFRPSQLLQLCVARNIKVQDFYAEKELLALKSKL